MQAAAQFHQQSSVSDFKHVELVESPVIDIAGVNAVWRKLLIQAEMAMTRLVQHNWPGNVRELSTVLEASLLEAVNGVIRAEDLAIVSDPQTTPAAQPAPRIENLELDAVIHHHVRYVLDLNRGNKLRTASQLGISRSTLYRILGKKTILAR